VPTEIVSAAGLKPKLPLLLVMIDTVCMAPGTDFGFDVGVE